MHGKSSDAASVRSCINCGYSLAGLADRPSRCPECGAAVEAASERRPEMQSGLGLLVWGLGLAILAFLIGGSLWATYSFGSEGQGREHTKMVNQPVLLAFLPALLACAGLRVVSGACGGRTRPLIRANAALLLTLGAAAALSLASGSGGGSSLSLLLNARQLLSSQVLSLLQGLSLLVLIGVGMWWGSECRWALARVCEATGLLRAAAWLRTGLVVFPVVVVVLALAFEFEQPLTRQIPSRVQASSVAGQPGVPPGVPPTSLVTNPWYGRARAGFNLAQCALWGVVLVAAAGTWQAAVLARARLGALATPTTPEPQERG